jgi:hypothetical protein
MKNCEISLENERIMQIDLKNFDMSNIVYDLPNPRTKTREKDRFKA